jgi:hypothetical protein
MPVEKPTTRPATTQSTKPKGKAKAGPSTKKNNPTDNTRKVAACTLRHQEEAQCQRDQGGQQWCLGQTFNRMPKRGTHLRLERKGHKK